MTNNNIPQQNSIELTEEFLKLFKLIETTNENVFVTGRAGTGKSTFLSYFRSKTRKKTVTLAPTGLAAVNVEGQTIHSFFRFPPRMLDPKDVRKLYNPVYRNLDTILIDEIPMVRADLFDAIDIFMRKNGKDYTKPFGGAQIVLFGDLFQLPPVVENEALAILRMRYASRYFFSSKAFQQMNLNVVELPKVFRQHDPKFIEALDKIRRGNILSNDLEIFNRRVIKDYKPDDSEFCITLTPTNKIANLKNQEKLNEIAGEPITYIAKLTGDFEANPKNLPVDLELRLKVGARVIFVKNDTAGEFVNGTLGIVSDLGTDWVKVRIEENGEPVTVKAMTWEKIKYNYDRENDIIVDEITGKLTQIPLRLAWALTIHKSQGLTFDNVFLDFSFAPWEHGHTYVALSRCRSIEGTVLNNKLYPNDVVVDSKVTDFVQLNGNKDVWRHLRKDEQSSLHKFNSDESNEK